MGNWPRTAVPATGTAHCSLWVTAASFPTAAKSPLSPGHAWDLKVRTMQALLGDWTVQEWHLPSGKFFDMGCHILKDFIDVGEIFQQMKKGVRAEWTKSTAWVRHHYFTFNHQYLSLNYMDSSIGSSADNLMKKLNPSRTWIPYLSCVLYCKKVNQKVLLLMSSKL